MNYLRTAILLAGLTALFMGIGYLIGGAGGAMIALCRLRGRILAPGRGFVEGEIIANRPTIRGCKKLPESAQRFGNLMRV